MDSRSVSRASLLPPLSDDHQHRKFPVVQPTGLLPDEDKVKEEKSTSNQRIIITTSSLRLQPPVAFLSQSAAQVSRSHMNLAASSTSTCTSSLLSNTFPLYSSELSKPIVTVSRSSQECTSLTPAFSRLSISQGENNRNGQNQENQEISLKQSLPTSSPLPFASTSFSFGKPSMPLQTGSRQIATAVRHLPPIQQQISKLKTNDSSADGDRLLEGETKSFSDDAVTDGGNNSLVGQNVLSLLNEEAAACNVDYEFEEIGRSGPPHMPTFTMQLTVDDITTEGVGRTKNAAKEDAAHKAIKQLRQKKTVLLPTVKSNTIGQLQEYLAKRHYPKNPKYKLTSRSGPDHAPTFEVSCKVLGESYIGRGGTKKEARFDAAKAALVVIMGSNDVNTQPKNAVISKGKLTTKRPVIKLSEESESEGEETQEQQLQCMSSALTTKQSEAEIVSKMVQKAYETGHVHPVNGSCALQYEDTLRDLAKFLGHQLTCSTQSTDHESQLVAVLMTLHLGNDAPLVHCSYKATEEEARKDAALHILLSLTATDKPTKQQL